MDFSLTPKQREVVELARAIAQEEIKVASLIIDKNGIVPDSLMNILKQSGMTQLAIPKEYGGAGLDILTVAMVAEQLAMGCAGIATICAANALATFPVLQAGNEEQKNIWCNCLNEGGMAAFALTEPGAGSDAGAVSCQAKKVDDGYLISGNKSFITNGPIADKIALFANTRQEGGIRGLTLFMVDAKAKGVSIGKKEDKMGIRASSTSEIIFEDYFVPDSQRIGREGRGFKIAMQTLQTSRPVVGALSVGIAQAALDEAVAYSQQRKQFGAKVSSFQMVQEMIANMAMKIEAARGLVYRACVMQMNNDPQAAMFSAMSKCYASDIAMEVTTDAVQVMGGVGYTRDFFGEKYMRDAKIMQLYEGTNQIQRLVIANEVLH